MQVTCLEKEKQELLQKLTQTNQELKHQLNLADIMDQIGKSITLIHPTQTLERIVGAALFLTNAEEGRLFLINPRAGTLNEPVHRKKARAVAAKTTRQISVALEIAQQRVGTLSITVATQRLTDQDLAEYEQMLRPLAGYANIGLTWLMLN